MRIQDIFSLIVIAGFISCSQQNKQPESTNVYSNESPELSFSQEPLNDLDNKFIDTHLEYADPAGNILIIKNSLPKGGLKFTDPNNGKEYVYAIFWTRIINNTADSFELNLNFPRGPFKMTPTNYFRIIIPSIPMTSVKAPLFNYGLTDLESHLSQRLEAPPSHHLTITNDEAKAFYIVTLFNQGVTGVLRTGLFFEDGNVYYRVNDMEIQCGSIDIDLKEMTSR